jgi:caa(3)-type oxidase subunit IV
MSDHAPSKKKTYLFVFLALTVLTLLEVAVTLPSLGVPHTPMALSLVGMALTKAAMVGWFFMHLNHEMKALKLTVALPFFFPALYAVVLIAEAAWRRLVA